jgi:hypothetical protein
MCGQRVKEKCTNPVGDITKIELIIVVSLRVRAGNKVTEKDADDNFDLNLMVWQFVLGNRIE